MDLIAHSQGGLVARAMLALHQPAWDDGLPRVEHLVTFSTPHEGAPLARNVAELDRSAVGRRLLDTAAWISDRSEAIPDPRSRAVGDMVPGSSLLDRLEVQDIGFGTRALSLSIPNDLVVPTDRARLIGHPFRVVAPEGLNGHDAIVGSRRAQGIAYDFLRDAAPACRSGWDSWGPGVGAVVSAVEGNAWRAIDALDRIAAWP